MDSDPLPKTIFLPISESQADSDPNAVLNAIEQSVDSDNSLELIDYITKYTSHLKQFFISGGILVQRKRNICFSTFDELAHSSNLDILLETFSADDLSNLEKIIQYFNNTHHSDNLNYHLLPYVVEPMADRFNKPNSKVGLIPKQNLNFFTKHLIVEALTPAKEKLIVRNFETGTANIGYELLIKSARNDNVSLGSQILRYTFREAVISYIDTQQKA